jgi:hypothetical protein
MPPDDGEQQVDPAALAEENARLKADLEATRRAVAEERNRADTLDNQVSQTNARVASAQAGQIDAQIAAADNTLSSLEQHIKNLKDQKSNLLAEGKFREASDLDEEMADAAARRLQAKQAKDYYAQQKTTIAAAPTDPVDQFIASNPGTYSSEDVAWIRQHRRFATDGNFRQRVVNAHAEAEKLGIAQRSPEYFQLLERRGYMRSDPPRNDGGGNREQQQQEGASAPSGYSGDDPTSGVDAGEGPEIIIREPTMPDRQSEGAAFNRAPENPQPRAAAEGSMRAAIAAAPTRRAMAAPGSGRRTVLEMTQSERDAAMAYAPHGMAEEILRAGEPAILQEWDRLRNSGAGRRIAAEWRDRRA